MKLPRVGALCAVLWVDTVDINSWTDTTTAAGPQEDHDYVECVGHFLGEVDGYLNIGNQASVRDGKVSQWGFVSKIPRGSVRRIVTVPGSPKRR